MRRHDTASTTAWRRCVVGLLVGGMLVSWPARSAVSQPEDRLVPFSLPWDDASSGPTDLSGWNRPIVGEADRLRAGPDGHLYRGTERVRLFGYDISAGAAFADRAVADTVAARLARFGVNYVRIAQNSNPAPAGWIDPATLATLSPEALDRLDYFIAQLGRRGIYVHLVLNHFRRVYPRTLPGFVRGELPEGWPQHGTGVTMFFPPVIELNRALARELLTHKNAYTGLPYAQDPRIAIVEITNEDGLVQLWWAGGLDPISEAHAVHLRPLRDGLQARWNRWLVDRYAVDATLRAGWDQGVSTGATELLTNRDFGQGIAGWRLEVHEGARAQWQVAPGAGPQGMATLQVRVDQASVEDWHVMVVQDKLRVREGQPYRLSFWARAARAGTTIALNLQQAHAPYRILASQPVVITLTDVWQQYSHILAATASDTNAKLNAIVGHQAQTLWLAGISLQEAGVSGLRADESATRGTVPLFTRAEIGLRSGPAQRDWMAFLFDVERQFFTDARGFLKDELQLPALLVGTQNDFSPATIQAGFDVTSMHAYWSHPAFPGRPWDPTNWFVANRSMVNARDDWNNLNRIAFRRWVGKPLVVDEYNHPQPNTFAAEGFPLAAVYGSFQDWDGLAGWAYREGWQNHWLTQDDWARPLIRNYFAIDTDPVKMLGGWLAAVLLRRGDITPGGHLVTVGLTDEQEQEIARTVGVGRDDEIIGGGAARLPLLHRVAVQPGSPGAGRVEVPAGGEPTVSDTSEITWDTHREKRGVVTVDTPRSKLVIGYGGGIEFPLGNVIVQPKMTAQQGFGVWAVTALDGSAPIGRARRLIIVALGYSQNSAMGWKIYPDHSVAGPPPEDTAVTVGRKWGEPPVRVEGVPAQITLPATRARVQAWALDARGQRMAALQIRVEDGRPVVDIGPAFRTLWYEVAIGE